MCSNTECARSASPSQWPTSTTVSSRSPLGTRRFGDQRFGYRSFGENMAADVLAKKVSLKRLSTGWEENCRRNVSSKDGWNKIYDDYNINYQKTCFCSHHIEDVIKKIKRASDMSPFSSVPRGPLGPLMFPSCKARSTRSKDLAGTEIAKRS